MAEKISDLDLKLEWNRTGTELKVFYGGWMIYSSATGYVSGDLSPRQVKWINEDYKRKRKNYKF